MHLNNVLKQHETTQEIATENTKAAQVRYKHKFDSNQPPSVAPRSRATRQLVALRLERVCSVLFTPIHLQIRIDNFFGIVEFLYLYGVDTGNQSRSN